MSPFEKQVFMQMIEGDLQQAWELFGADQFRLGLHHLKEAVVKGEQLCDMAETEPAQPQQPTLDV